MDGKLRGNIRTSSSASGKPVYDFLFVIIELFLLALTIELRRYRAKHVKTRCFQEGVGQFEPRFQEEGVIPTEYFLVSRKLDTFFYLTVQTAPCYMQSLRHNTGV